jgi:hypothetical protein
VAVDYFRADVIVVIRLQVDVLGRQDSHAHDAQHGQPRHGTRACFHHAAKYIG